MIKLVNSILGQAVTEGASDIHFEREEGEMRIRFRIDGVLQEAARVPKRMVNGVVSRIKIMSELDIAEKRVPQDGRVGVTIEDRRVDLRVTTLPTQRGEGATIRILDESAALRTLDDLGMAGEERERFENSVRQPYGAVLVTGPTGAGKSTTLYAALQEINDVDKNIITIEDPVEYRLNGVNQIGVHRKAGLTFATGLRSVLRADPDVIMVGEIRDAETARIAIEAALTGHMVLSTLHTNDAPGAITRLTEMGIESFLTSSAVDCVVAQRLARVLCPHCKQPHRDPAGGAGGGGLPGRAPTSRPTSRSAAPAATGSATAGRIGVYSVMVLSERIKEMVVGARARGRDRQGRARGGDADPARGGPGQGARGRHQHRGGRPCRQLAIVASQGSQRRADGRSRGEPWKRRKTLRLRRGADPDGQERASDVHLSPGFPPAIRVRGRIVPLEEYGTLSPQHTRDTVYSLLNDDQRKRFESNKQLDLAYAVPGVARFRVNCFFQRGAISAAFRRIPHEIPKLSELGLPPVLEEFTQQAARLRAGHRARPARASRRPSRR